MKVFKQIIPTLKIAVIITIIGCSDQNQEIGANEVSEVNESLFFSEDGQYLGGLPTDNDPWHAPYLREFAWNYLSASKPVMPRTEEKEDYDLYHRDSLMWETNPFYGWTSKNKKEDGSAYDLSEDGLKIHLFINSQMQEHAEWAVTEHLQELQSALNRSLHKRGLNQRPNTDKVSRHIDSLILKSDRYKNMAAAGVSYSLIKEVFNKQIPMRIFDWDSRELDTVLSPKDSIWLNMKHLKAGLMSLDPKNGSVKAWVGGANYRHFKSDNIYTRRRQAGSLALPFIYGSAIQMGSIEPCTTFPNTEYCFTDPDKLIGDPEFENGISVPRCVPSNQGDIGSPISIKAALAGSFSNIPLAVADDNIACIVYTINMLERCGITRGTVEPVAATLEGQFNISLHDITSAYCAIANKGMYSSPQLIARIEDSEGNILTESQPSALKEVMNEESTYALVDMLKGTINGVKSGNSYVGTGMRLRSRKSELRPYAGIKTPLAGKTGTTQSLIDGWFVGFTPELVTGVWVGAEMEETSFSSIRQGQGANTALPIWGYYMNKLYADTTSKLPLTDFEKPEGYYFETDCEYWVEDNFELD
jgi:penicillin-binding protein 1A